MANGNSGQNSAEMVRATRITGLLVHCNAEASQIESIGCDLGRRLGRRTGFSCRLASLASHDIGCCGVCSCCPPAFLEIDL